jgi:8-oxo-dGTP pyrophosphatase MutT (NUDIX family)
MPSPRPAVTVAAVVERDNRFLLVEEETRDGLRLNQPAGHVESGESLLAATVRETLEESGWSVEPQHVVGIYTWRSPDSGVTYLRVALSATALVHDAGRALDTGIVRALWMTAEEITAAQARHRSPLVQRCVDDYCAGRRLPLSWLTNLQDAAP